MFELDTILQVAGGILAAGATSYAGLRAKAWRIRGILKGDPNFKEGAVIDTIKEDGWPLVYNTTITHIRLTWHGWGSRVWIEGTGADSGKPVKRAWTIIKFMSMTRLYANS